MVGKRQRGQRHGAPGTVNAAKFSRAQAPDNTEKKAGAHCGCVLTRERVGGRTPETRAAAGRRRHSSLPQERNTQNANLLSPLTWLTHDTSTSYTFCLIEDRPRTSLGGNVKFCGINGCETND